MAINPNDINITNTKKVHGITDVYLEDQTATTARFPLINKDGSYTSVTRVATQTEANDGADDVTVMTPLKVNGVVSAVSNTKQANIQFKDEGVNLGTAGTIDTIDFVGGAVTGSRAGNTLLVTLNVPAALTPKGNWDATANLPNLVSSTGNIGDWYQVSVAGTTSLDGQNTWTVGDSLFFGTNNKWNRVPSSSVTSVFGRSGNVIASNTDYTASQIALSTFTSGAGTITSADTTLSAIQKLNGNIGLKQDKTSVAVPSIVAGNATTSQKLRITDQTLINDIDVDSFFSITPTKDATGKIILATSSNVRYGSTVPTVLATDKKNDTYIRTTDGLAVNATATNLLSEWIFDGTQWSLVSKTADAVIQVTGVTTPVTFPVATLPGTPVFTPNTPGTTGFIYQLNDGTFASWNGTQYVSSPAPTADWSINGNTLGTTKILGTTDNTALKIQSGTAPTTVNATSTGNFGVGTASPTAKLHTVDTTANSSQGAFTNTTNYDEGTVISANGTITEIKMNNSGQANWTISNDGAFKINNTGSSASPYTAGTNVLTATIAGNVGIGTTTPANTLQIGTATTANTGGIRLPITSASTAQTGGAIGVNANGDIVKIADSTVGEFKLPSTTISALTVNNVALYTVPVGKTLILTKAILQPTTVTGVVTVPPALSIGANATLFNDFLVNTTVTGATVLNKAYIYQPNLSTVSTYPAGSVVQVKVNTAQTGATALTYTVDLIGYLI